MLIETQARSHEQTYSDEHRKLLGTHYTPDSIVDYIVRRSLSPLMKSSENIQKIKVLDPACGSGLFLLKVFDILSDNWRQTFGPFGPEEATHILANCLFGIDIDERAVIATRRHLLQKASLPESELNLLSKNIVIGNALELKPSFNQISLEHQSDLESQSSSQFLAHSFDCVVGNPPYIRIQNTELEKRAFYSQAYTTAAGRFDISTLFLELSDYLLKVDGRLGFIFSNKILTTAGAKKLRTFLLAHFSIQEIVDLTDTKLFEAAVLPMILLASRSKENGHHIAYSIVTESHNASTEPVHIENLLELIQKSEIPFEATVSSANRVFQVQRFYASPPSLRANVWTFHSETENRLLSKLRFGASHSLNQLADKISVGLKTTADNVFIKPMTKEFITKRKLESELIFPLLESHNIDRWRPSWDSDGDLFVLYPHVERKRKVVPIDLELFPHAKAYLEANRPQLEARSYLAESNREWYEIWVHQSPNDFRQSKIITPDISTSNRFALDTNGYFVNGTCFYIILKDKSDVSYYTILGLLNSKLMEYFHKTTTGNSLYAKRFRYWTSYIAGYPISKRLTVASELQSSLAHNVAILLHSIDPDERKRLEAENDLICYESFELSPSEIREIESTLSMHGANLSAKGSTTQ
jgi:tRNA1(Val) A37 N6-methylase TrmN6